MFVIDEQTMWTCLCFDLSLNSLTKMHLKLKPPMNGVKVISLKYSEYPIL